MVHVESAATTLGERCSVNPLSYSFLFYFITYTMIYKYVVTSWRSEKQDPRAYLKRQGKKMRPSQ